MNQKETQSLPQPKAFLFDWDNTLVDVWDTIHFALNETLTAMGHTPWTLEESRIKAARSLRTYFPELFGDRWKEARDIFYAVFNGSHLKNLKPMMGAQELLEALHAQNYFIGLVSNKRGSILREEVEYLGWPSYFAPHAIVGAQDTPTDKPDPGPVHYALRHSHLKAGSDIWFVGDTPVDMQCAHAAGCWPVLVAEDSVKDRIAPWFPQVYAHDLRDLKTQLVKIKVLKEGT